MESEPKSGKRPLVFPAVKTFFRFFICGPETEKGWALWALLFPITFPILLFFQCVIGVLSAILGAATGNVVIVDGGGGDGFFDEVSTRRRDDYQFITGTGKYAKEG